MTRNAVSLCDSMKSNKTVPDGNDSNVRRQ